MESNLEVNDVEINDSEKQPKTKFSFLGEIHPLMVVFGLILCIVALTYIIPGGEFGRKEVQVMGMKKMVVIPGSFHFIQSTPQGFGLIWTSFMRGAKESADIAWAVFICTGAFFTIIETGAVTAAFNTLIKKLGDRSHILIPALVFAFGLGGGLYGMYEDATPFIFVITPLMLSLKYDSLVAVMIIQYSIVVGGAAGFLNPFNVGIAQALAEIPMTSGIGIRFIMWLALMTGTCIYIMRYASKVRKKPEASLVYEDDLKNRAKMQETNSDELKTMTIRDRLVLILLVIGFATIIFGVVKKGWWFEELGSAFLFMGIVIPLVGGMKINQMIENNIKGMTTVMTAMVILACSRIIKNLLIDSSIMDTILFYISNSLGGFSKSVTVVLMFIVSSTIMPLINSSSGMAGTLMPIMAPLSDVLGYSRQLAVTAFQLGTGTFQCCMPWDGITFALCSIAGINFFTYLKKALKFSITFYIPACAVILFILTMIGYK